jgi:hypothetical protein
MTPTAYIEEGLFFYFLHGLLYMEVVVEPSVVWAARCRITVGGCRGRRCGEKLRV